MRVLVWVFFGLGISGIAAVVLHVRRQEDWFAIVGAGVLGALAGGGLARVVSVSADGGLNAGTFAALVGAVLFVTLAYLGLGARRGWRV